MKRNWANCEGVREKLLLDSSNQRCPKMMEKVARCNYSREEEEEEHGSKKVIPLCRFTYNSFTCEIISVTTQFERKMILDLFKCVSILLAWCALCEGIPEVNKEEESLVDRGFRAMYRVYEDCQQRNIAVSPCLKKKAIAFFERLGRIRTLPLSENFELIRNTDTEMARSSFAELETQLGRTASSKDEILNEILFDRVASLLNSFNVQIRLPRTSPGELKRGMEEGRGKMKKMMGMMMMGMAMKMAAMIPIALGVLFLLAGKALIISKIALVLSLIIGLKKLLSSKQSNDHGGWQHGGGGWDRTTPDNENTIIYYIVTPKSSIQDHVGRHTAALRMRAVIPRDHNLKTIAIVRNQ
ncbi:hypothetical protein APICC_06883 [Apis cerana cerana]|uniref:Uncharacterized protein n=1 Tax=Apis cerana cerana TaxID=94128 RepID=A0A2A3EPG1_APICC|nr:hypothetical protein APICC_06883 [Apis cerana cerana]